jgi:hypothetical protein
LARMKLDGLENLWRVVTLGIGGTPKCNLRVPKNSVVVSRGGRGPSVQDKN